MVFLTVVLLVLVLTSPTAPLEVSGSGNFTHNANSNRLLGLKTQVHLVQWLYWIMELLGLELILLEQFTYKLRYRWTNIFYRYCVGIGTNAPAYKLDVSGSGNFTDNLTVTGSATISNILTLIPQDPLPTGSPTGSFAVSSSVPPKPYFYDGTSWNALY
jgi:hypothetical protein